MQLNDVADQTVDHAMKLATMMVVIGALPCSTVQVLDYCVLSSLHSGTAN